MDSFPFAGFSIIFFIIFGIVIGGIIFVIVKGLMTWNKNNHSPRLTVDATIISRRMELQVDGSEYGMLAEGDRG